jgi:hypothetical protein
VASLQVAALLLALAVGIGNRRLRAARSGVQA